MFKVGDIVQRTDGKPFRDGSQTLTIREIKTVLRGKEIWFKETDTYVYERDNYVVLFKSGARKGFSAWIQKQESKDEEPDYSDDPMGYRHSR